MLSELMTQRLGNRPQRWLRWSRSVTLSTLFGLTLLGSMPAVWAQNTTAQAGASVATQQNGGANATKDNSATELSRELLGGGPEKWTSPEGLSSALQVMILLTVISLAPAVLLMTTSFVRVIIVLGLLRQALGTQQLPPGQVLTSIALFVTLLVMSPVWKKCYDEAIVPYQDRQISLEEALDKGLAPIRRFMIQQISMTGNDEDIAMFCRHLPDQPEPETYGDVPITALVPAFMLSELKTAFLMGFKIYLPFMILDFVVASVTISMGMLMLPPVLISLPFKLLLFVLVDGWHLVVEMLMMSFQPFS